MNNDYKLMDSRSPTQWRHSEPDIQVQSIYEDTLTDIDAREKRFTIQYDFYKNEGMTIINECKVVLIDKFIMGTGDITISIVEHLTLMEGWRLGFNSKLDIKQQYS